MIASFDTIKVDYLIAENNKGELSFVAPTKADMNNRWVGKIKSCSFT